MNRLLHKLLHFAPSQTESTAKFSVYNFIRIIGNDFKTRDVYNLYIVVEELKFTTRFKLKRHFLF